MKLLIGLFGYVLLMLGVITFIHSDHNTLGILITFGGLLSVFEGLPKYD